MEIRRYKRGEESAVWKVYFAATHESNARDYHADLIERWAPHNQDMGQWTARLAQKNPFVAVVDGEIIGMAEIETDGFIDYFYVHPKWQGRGIGKALLAALEAEAAELGVRRIFADVSVTAKSFFLSRGFCIIEARSQVILGHPAPNFRMQKILSSEPDGTGDGKETMKKPLFDKLSSLLNLSPEQSYAILDIGCGTGDLLRTLSLLVGNRSHLIGIDAGPASIAAAQAQHLAGEYRHHKFEQQLPFGDEQFDLVLSTDVLECVVDKAALLQEMARVLKPRGTVLCAHWDWDTAVYASEQTDLLRQWVHTFADWQQGWMDSCDGLMGRKLWGLFQRSQRFTGHIEVFALVETRYEPGQYGYDRLQDLKGLVEREVLAVADYERIHQEMTRLTQCGEYFYSLNSYIYVGQKCA